MSEDGTHRHNYKRISRKTTHDFIYQIVSVETISSFLIVVIYKTASTLGNIREPYILCNITLP